MAELKPCGTYAAYRRHKRNGEPVDDACAQAGRDQKNGRVEARRDTEREVIAETVSSITPPPTIDPLEDAIENYRFVVAAMEAGDVRSIGTLSKRRQELVELINELQGATTEVSLADELAAARRQRGAAS